MMPVRVVVVGTGTEVGKTHVSTCLLASARARGMRVGAYKPVATGIDGRCDDAERHAEALGSPYVHPTFTYRRPVSPHLAAREEGRPIDLDVIGRRAAELALAVDVLLIEGAGGLFSPLSDTESNITLVKRLLPAHVILVAADRLGVLHDVGACLAAAVASGVAITSVVLSAPATPDESTGSNARELARIGAGRNVAVFPRARFDDEESHAAARVVWERLALTTS